MRRKLFLVIPAIVIVIAVAWFWRSAYNPFAQYNPLQPFAKKAQLIEQWIPADATLWTLIDVAQLQQQQPPSPLAQVFAQGMGSRLTPAMGQVVLSRVGLAAGVVVWPAQQDPQMMVLLQMHVGEEHQLLAEIAGKLAQTQGALAAETVGAYQMHVEGTQPQDFGIVILDRQHVAVGEQALLRGWLSQPQRAHARLGQVPQALLYGKLTLTDRMKALLPVQLAHVTGASMQSTDGSTLALTIPCASAQEAQDMQLFLAGFKALFALQQADAPQMQNAMQAVAATAEGNNVVLTAELQPLLPLLE